MGGNGAQAAANNPGLPNPQPINGGRMQGAGSRLVSGSAGNGPGTSGFSIPRAQVGGASNGPGSDGFMIARAHMIARAQGGGAGNGPGTSVFTTPRTQVGGAGNDQRSDGFLIASAHMIARAQAAGAQTDTGGGSNIGPISRRVLANGINARGNGDGAGPGSSGSAAGPSGGAPLKSILLKPDSARKLRCFTELKFDELEDVYDCPEEDHTPPPDSSKCGLLERAALQNEAKESMSDEAKRNTRANQAKHFTEQGDWLRNNNMGKPGGESGNNLSPDFNTPGGAQHEGLKTQQPFNIRRAIPIPGGPKGPGNIPRPKFAIPRPQMVMPNAPYHSDAGAAASAPPPSPPIAQRTIFFPRKRDGSLSRESTSSPEPVNQREESTSF